MFVIHWIANWYFKVCRLIKSIHQFFFQKNIEKNCIAGEGVKFFLTAKINSLKTGIEIGRMSHIHGDLTTFNKKSKIKVGVDCFIGPSTRIWAMEEIIIGDRVLISHNVHIMDSNSHSTSAEKRHLEMVQVINGTRDFTNLDDVAKSRIKICDDVWIGFGAVILKGVTIGKGAIIGANAVITHDVSDYSIVVGSPQRIVGSSKP